jgi:hypothetical protein
MMIMKNKRLLIFFALGLMLLMPAMLNAQSDITNLFKAGATDIQTLAQGYIKPVGYGFADGLGTNWYNTAATHKVLGFDITIGAGGLFVPSSDKTFSLAGLQALQVVNGQTTAPTIGGKGDGVELRLTAPNGQTITDFTTPKGVTPVIPAVNAQITIGLPLGNDLSFRFVPNIHNNNYKVGLWGIGLKHNIKQWIPGVKLLPFDAAVMVGYTHVNFNYNFSNSIMPSDLADPSYTLNVPADVSYDNQGMRLSASSLMANIIVSKRLLFFTPYVGFGVTSSNFDFNFTGNYPVLGTYHADNNSIDVKTLVNPIPLHYSSFSPGLTVGFRLKILWILAFHAQYTLQKYSTASIGFGINIR